MTETFEPACLTGAPYRWMHPSFRDRVAQLRAWPAPEEYDDLAALVPRETLAPLPRFVSQTREALTQAGGYERHVADLRAVPTRAGSWHDFFNMAVWAHFPALRWALNSLHVDPGPIPRDPRNGRTPAQNLATSFDETGMIVASLSRSVLDGLRALRFKRVFWEQRAELRETTRFWIVGHGLLESLQAPHPRLVARSLLVEVAPATALRDHELMLRCDSLVGRRIHDWRRERIVFDPIPVCAIPGFSDDQSADFYEDRRRLPFDPISRRPTAPRFLALGQD